MSFLSDIVTNDEFVFRGILDAPGVFDRNGKLSTGCLKQSNGVSVDRDGGRKDSDVVEFMISRRPTNRKPFVKFLKMNVGNIRNHEWEVEAKPIENENEFHAEMREKYPKKHLDAENATAIINEGTEISLPEVKQQETPKSPDRCVKHTESSSGVGV